MMMMTPLTITKSNSVFETIQSPYTVYIFNKMGSHAPGHILIAKMKVVKAYLLFNNKVSLFVIKAYKVLDYNRCFNHGIYDETLTQTPGLFGWPHPFPHDVTPYSTGWPCSAQISGPPESP